MKRALLISRNLIGDGLYVGPVAAEWHRQHGQEYDEVHLLTLKNHALPIYDGMGLPWKIVFEPEGDYDLTMDFDISKAFQICDKKKCHLIYGYAELVGVEMPKNVPLLPNYQPPSLGRELFNRNVIMLSMHSMSCASQENPPKPPNKMLPWEKWRPLIATLRQEYPECALRVIGGKNDLIPDGVLDLTEREATDWLGMSIKVTAQVMQGARAILTVDNGMGHLAASQKLNQFLLVPMCLAMHYIVPWGNPGLRVVHVDPPVTDAETINWHLRSAIKDWKEKESCPK